jgi:hypothetical protein
MHFRFTVLETNLNRTEFRWKWLRFLQQTFVLATILSAGVLLFGTAIIAGWVTSKSAATTFYALLAVIGFIVWAILVIALVARTIDRNWLAAALERADSRLLDRLNTLLFLERNRGKPGADSFSLRIARQTQALLAEKPAPSPFRATGSWAWLLILAATLTVTVLVYQRFSPWERLLIAAATKSVNEGRSEKSLELALPPANTLEENQSWGEVRITEPGADLKVTKVDVVPLQIEAAANQSLKQVGWVSTINGTEESPHELPPPTEPKYAVYQPVVYLDELRLSDWDVMTYYARASTENDNAFASEVFFLEVRPFREDILKMPGGASSKACINELSGLINRQQHIIRQTHHHVQKPQSAENLQAQDRKKLAEAETDLGEATQHLYARTASSMENLPIGDLLDNLAKAEKSLTGASKQLAENSMPSAQNLERSALADLVAARKNLQKVISDNPKAFEEPEEQTPAPDLSSKLNAMAEFRNESKAAREFVQNAVEQQKKIEQQARAAARSDYQKLADQQKRLEENLSSFEQQHPQPFKGIETASKETHQAMAQASESLQNRKTDARNDAQKARQQLEKLNEAVKDSSAGQQLSDAYRLKKMLDQQIEVYGQCASPDGKVSDSDLQKTVNASRETINQLKKIAEQEPTRDAFGQPLRDSLNGTNKVDLDARLNQVQQAQDPASKRDRAAGVKEALGKVSKAFNDSQPQATQMAQKTDSLKTPEQESFGRGLSQLESLIKQQQRGRNLSAEEQAKQSAEALFNLQTGLRSEYGNNENVDQILLKMEQLLKTEQPLEVGNLKKLMDELQHFSVETSDQLARKQDKPEVTNIDAARLPPAYRGRIQKYFQKLSEK